MIASFIVLVLALLAMGYVLVEERVKTRRLSLELDIERSRKAETIERLHAIANSAGRGAPLVKWHRHQPLPTSAESFYWRVMIAGEVHFFTDDALKVARQRANFLLHGSGARPTTAKSEAGAVVE